MAISLNKGGNLSLSKTDPSLTRLLIGLGWDERATSGAEFDLDASVFLLNNMGKVRGDHDFIFYNQLKSDNGAVEHTGDNRSGAGDGDDEVINVDLSRIPAHVQSLVFTVNSFTGQTFEKVAGAFCRIVNAGNNSEVARYNLSAQGNHTALILAKIYRHNGEWKMHAIGENVNGRTFQEIVPHVLPYV